MAEELARRGDRVYATMRDLEGRNAGNAAALEAFAKEEKLALRVIELDVTQQASVDAAVAAALADGGHLDVVVNNAGIAAIGVSEAYTPEQFEQLYAINVFGVQRVNRAVLPSMRKRRSGLLIHLSSAAGRVTVPAMAVYCSSKFALEAIADAYRYELLPFGIDSVLVEPGIYKTPIFDRLMYPGDAATLASYGASAEFADRVLGVFKGAIGAQTDSDADEVVTATLQLIDTPSGQRPFRTIVSAAVKPLLEPYNDAADGLRPIVAQIFAVPELAGAGEGSGAA
jgi:NAD(P)-dependent dehydrogenase (short-subunit alcohol dehydrogenase family)